MYDALESEFQYFNVMSSQGIMWLCHIRCSCDEYRPPLTFTISWDLGSQVQRMSICPRAHNLTTLHTYCV